MTKCLYVGGFNGFKSFDQVGDTLGTMVKKMGTGLVLVSGVLEEMLGLRELGGLVIVASNMKPVSR